MTTRATADAFAPAARPESVAARPLHGSVGGGDANDAREGQTELLPLLPSEKMDPREEDECSRYHRISSGASGQNGRGAELGPPQPQPPHPPTPPDPIRLARRLLYVSHLFAQFSEVTWQFCLILFLAAFARYESLFLVGTYGAASGLTVCLSGAVVGRYIDAEVDRLRAARRFIWAENTAVLGATACCYLLLSRDDVRRCCEPPPEDGSSVGWLSRQLAAMMDGLPVDAASVALLVVIHVLGAVAKVLDGGFLVAIERDWIVVMSTAAAVSPPPPSPPPSPSRLVGGAERPERQLDGSSAEAAAVAAASARHEWLSDTNVALKQIDLGCKVVAPSAAGFIIAAFGEDDLRGAALLVGAVNASALVVEYVCTRRICDLVPELGEKGSVRGGADAEADRVEEGEGGGIGGGAGHVNGEEREARALARPDNSDARQNDICSMEDFSKNENGKTVEGNPKWFGLCPVPDGMRVFMEQPIAPGGIALALLYLNILTFGAIMTAYLVWRGMRLQTIGIWRGVSSAIGLMGTVVFHYSAQRLSLEQTGMWSILFQFAALTLSYVSLFVDDYDASITMLIAGVCTSRVGLWVFDIAITQLMQELIPEHARGVVGGVQQSLNSFFELLAYVLGMVFPDPRYFYVLVFAGYASVGVAAATYALGVYARRDKLRSGSVSH